MREIEDNENIIGNNDIESIRTHTHTDTYARYAQVGIALKYRAIKDGTRESLFGQELRAEDCASECAIGLRTVNICNYNMQLVILPRVSDNGSVFE